jgi:hypothetical protein
MVPSRRVAHAQGMSTDTGSRISIEFAGSDPIRGSLETSNGKVRPFWGWLELIEALSRVSTNAPKSSSSPSGPQEETT